MRESAGISRARADRRSAAAQLVRSDVLLKFSRFFRTMWIGAISDCWLNRKSV